MKSIRHYLLILISVFCINAFAQPTTQISAADKTYMDMSRAKNQAQMFEACQAELKIALGDPEKYIEKKTNKINNLLANDETLAYWETFALSQILKAGIIKDPGRIYNLSRTTTDILEVVNEDMKEKDKTKKTWGPVYVVVDFIHGLFHTTDKKEADATQLIELLSSIAIGYGEKALDIDGALEKSKTEKDQSFLLNITSELSKSRGLAAIQQSGMKIDYDVSFAALNALAQIAKAEEQKQGASIDPKKIESINVLEQLAYYDPLLSGPHVDCVVDIQRSDRNCIAQKQTQAITYIGLLGDIDFLIEYLKFSSNKSAINTASGYLGKETPYPYYDLLNGASNFIGTLKDFAIMSSYSKISWENIPFSGGGPSWAETKLIDPGKMNAFSEMPGLNYTISPSTNGVGIAALNIPTMTQSIPFISTQWWTIPEALKSAEMMRTLFYIIRVVPSAALLTDGSTIYKIDAINKKVVTLSDPSQIDKTKSYVSVTVTLSDGKILKYIIWTSNVSERQSIIDYIKSSALINPGVKMDIKYSNDDPVQGATPKTAPKPVTQPGLGRNLSIQVENKISQLLKNSNLSFKEQADVLNAFKSRASLASPKVLTKFMDGNSIYSNVEVFTNPNGSTVLKIVRGLTSPDGIINFLRNFTYDINGNLVEKDSVDYADGSGAIPLDNETAALLEEEISDYNNSCKNFTPRID